MVGYDVGNLVVSLMGDEDIEVGGGDFGFGDGFGGVFGDVSYSLFEDCVIFYVNEGVNFVGISVSCWLVFEFDSFELIRVRFLYYWVDFWFIVGIDDCGISFVREEEGGGVVVKICYF